jgi:hypothetical protein
VYEVLVCALKMINLLSARMYVVTNSTFRVLGMCDAIYDIHDVSFVELATDTSCPA